MSLPNVAFGSEVKQATPDEYDNELARMKADDDENRAFACDGCGSGLDDEDEDCGYYEFE